MREMENTWPDSDMWPGIFGSWRAVYDILGDGEVIMSYQRKQDKIYAAEMAYTAEFEGFKAIAMNKTFINSAAFKSVYDPEKHDLMIAYGIIEPGKIRYSLYSDKIDVSEIAKKYGGGGHKGAAGFYSDKLWI